MRIQDLPSDDELLAEYAEPAHATWEKPSREGKWVLKGHGDLGLARVRESMLALIKMNLLLDHRVTDTATSEFMYEIVRRLVALEDR